MTYPNQVTAHNENTTPQWFTVAATFALIWNFMGVMAFVGQITITPEMLAELPQAEQALYTAIPMWATIAFACAVFSGLLGSIALLLKKLLAVPLFLLSLVAVAVQMFHAFIISNSWQVLGAEGAIMPAMVIIVAIILVRLAGKAKTNHWLT